MEEESDDEGVDVELIDGPSDTAKDLAVEKYIVGDRVIKNFLGLRGTVVECHDNYSVDYVDGQKDLKLKARMLTRVVAKGL